jgi:hypothetical protein
MPEFGTTTLRQSKCIGSNPREARGGAGGVQSDGSLQLRFPDDHLAAVNSSSVRP